MFWMSQLEEAKHRERAKEQQVFKELDIYEACTKEFKTLLMV